MALEARSLPELARTETREPRACATGFAATWLPDALRVFCGMRPGYATTAGAHDEPAYRIQQRMRHKSADTTTGYIRAGEQWTKSGLKGFGF